MMRCLAGLRPAMAWLLVSSGAAAWAQAPEGDGDASAFFESRVRPVLVESCLKCHGEEKPKGGLRLVSRSALLEGGETGPAVVPGKPEESLLIAAVRHEGPEMPPRGKLPEREVEALARWVRMGAPWPGGDPSAPAAAIRRPGFRITDQDRNHWAFRPLRAPAVPATADPSAVANPVDAFLLDGLAARGLRPNPPAPRRELIRRVSFDLTGLPPSPEEVEAFVADHAPDAYEGLIDRLLASPRYGERWGRHWLDLVRFAETNSYENDDAKPNAWRFRDYVIRSLNDDKPFDRFIREHLAGDELPDGGADGLIATGFYRLGIHDPGAADKEQARFDALDDVIATTSQTFLGLTVDCARCHDHKLDPIPQKDYYRLLSFFNNITPYRNGGPTDEQPVAAGPAAEKQREQRAREQASRREAVQAELAEIEDRFRSLYAQAKGETLATPAPVDLEDLTFRFYRDTWDRLPDFAGLNPEESGPLRRGLFDLAPRSRDDAFGFVYEGTLVVPKDGHYTFHLDSDDGSRLAVAGSSVVEHDGVHELGGPRDGSVELAKGRVPIRLEYFQKASKLGLEVAWSGPDFARRALSASAAPSTTTPPPSALTALAQKIADEGAGILGEEEHDRYRQLRRELAQLRSGRGSRGDMALCVTETGTKPRPTFLLIRGNPGSKGDEVEPGFLEVLGQTSVALPTPAPGAKTSGRRSVLADWIASPDNPLTARVMANRVWQHHFGRGIVRSPNNFGVQGDKPTHPALLDWLATELIRGGWRLKPIHRLIVTSNAYRMSSRLDPASARVDPSNDLLWRFEMRRLDAEEIRDAVLAVSGTLNPRMGGPGIYPEIPREVLAGQSRPGYGWGTSPPEEQARRSVYIHVKRSLLTPILEGFDLAETDRSSPIRFSTTQPTQALAMLNGAFLNRQAAAFADRLARDAGDDPARRVDRAFALAAGRPARPEEVERALALIARFRARGGDERAAWSAFGLLVLNLNEFLYLD